MPQKNGWLHKYVQETPGGYQMEHKSEQDFTRATMSGNHIVFMEAQWANQEKPFSLLLAPGRWQWNRVFHFGLHYREGREETAQQRTTKIIWELWRRDRSWAFSCRWGSGTMCWLRVQRRYREHEATFWRLHRERTGGKSYKVKQGKFPVDKQKDTL